MKLPKLKIKNTGLMTDIDGKKLKFQVTDYITLKQTNYPKKIFIIQKLLFENGKKEIRIGYYIIGKKPRMRNKWVWGQFCPLFPKKDLVTLIRKAKVKKLI